MAEHKKSFILYCDLLHTVKKMPKEKAGELFLTILQYVNDENPVIDDMVIDLVFEPIKQQLKRDLRRWEGERESRSNAGREGGIKSAAKRKQNQAKPSSASNGEAKPSTTSKNEANQAVSVTENVTVTEREESPAPPVKVSYSVSNAPSLAMCEDFFVQCGKPRELGSKFYHDYNATGWMKGGSPIINWTSLAQKWVLTEKAFNPHEKIVSKSPRNLKV